MKQVVQNYKTGKLEVEEVAEPILKANGILVKTQSSLISSGTEKDKIILAKKSIIGKIIARPDQLALVLNNVKQEGFWATFKKAMNKLDSPISLGYSAAGIVVKVGDLASEYKIGDRLACVGEKYAAHSEINFVPQTMCVPIPGQLSFQEASFVGLGAIALNAVNNAQLISGGSVAVIGLGLLGQLTAQIAKAKGFRVFGVELEDKKIALAKELGMDAGGNIASDDIEALIADFTGGCGVDAVIITAASKDNQPLVIAGRIARDKAGVILVGAVPIDIPRKDYYEKELTFMVSRGFGAGLYYNADKGRQYAFGYTLRGIKDNMHDFLRLVEEKKVRLNRLITHRFKLDDAAGAYELINSGSESFIGVLFEYDGNITKTDQIIINAGIKQSGRPVKVGFIGAGSFASGYLLPIIKQMKQISLKSVSCASGINSKSIARKFGFASCVANSDEIINDPAINCVFIATRHDTHASICREALKKHKVVFVEKPLAVNESQLNKIVEVYDSGTSKLMVGFNRRFSPFVIRLKKFFTNKTGPLIMNYRINAGYLPPDHWLHSQDEGGGRIIGEVCHFVDLLQFIAGSSPVKVFAEPLGYTRQDMSADNNVNIVIKFADGSVGNIMYCAIGDVSYPRERIEVFGQNSVAMIDNFRQATFTRKSTTKKMFRFNRDMGHSNEIKLFSQAVSSGTTMPIEFNELLITTLTTFAVVKSLNTKQPQELNFKDWVVC